jgi:hypothetical protein
MNMHRVFVAAVSLQSALEEVGHPFCFIGGLALQRWGETRFTQDADATVLTRFEHDEAVARNLLSRFKSRHAEGLDFALRYRVLLLEAENGVGLDVALGVFDFEARAIERSSLWRLTEGSALRTCSAEDLIVHKAFASREKDWMDIHGILLRQGSKLNIAQIFEELRPLVALKDDITIVPRLEAMIRKAKRPGSTV